MPVQVFDGGISRRPVVYTGFGVNVIMVGSGWWCIPGKAFLWARRRVVRVSWRWETRAKGVMLGMWRWARRIVVVVVVYRYGLRCELKALDHGMLCDFSFGMDSFGDDVRSGDFSEEGFMCFVISRCLKCRLNRL